MAGGAIGLCLHDGLFSSLYFEVLSLGRQGTGIIITFQLGVHPPKYCWAQQ